MKLLEWRNSRTPRWTLERTAAALTELLNREVQARTLHRYEIGETQITTEMTEAVRVLTDGVVLATDFHEVRKEKLITMGLLKPIQRRDERMDATH